MQLFITPTAIVRLTRPLNCLRWVSLTQEGNLVVRHGMDDEKCSAYRPVIVPTAAVINRDMS